MAFYSAFVFKATTSNTGARISLHVKEISKSVFFAPVADLFVFPFMKRFSQDYTFTLEENLPDS